MISMGLVGINQKNVVVSVTFSKQSDSSLSYYVLLDKWHETNNLQNPIYEDYRSCAWPLYSLVHTFLKHCIMTNKAVGTLWRTLSKPPQRRHCPDLRPRWLLVGTPSAIRPELAFSRAEHSLPYSDVSLYIFAILYLSSMHYVYRFLWPFRSGWLLFCCLYKEVYIKKFKRVSFWLSNDKISLDLTKGTVFFFRFILWKLKIERGPSDRSMKRAIFVSVTCYNILKV